MNNRLKNSIEVLQRAYLNETLTAGDCNACAVGNLVAASSYEGASMDWRYVFCTNTISNTQEFYDPSCYDDEQYSLGLEAIKATDYSVDELARIEFAFEKALSEEEAKDMPEHQSQWIRLQAVLKVLFDIEGIEYDEEVEQPFLEKALS